MNISGSTNYLVEMERLENLELSQTLMTWDDLPRDVQQNNEMNIDLRPENLRENRLNNAQNTHIVSIHQSASKNSAY